MSTREELAARKHLPKVFYSRGWDKRLNWAWSMEGEGIMAEIWGQRIEIKAESIESQHRNRKDEKPNDQECRTVCSVRRDSKKSIRWSRQCRLQPAGRFGDKNWKGHSVYDDARTNLIVEKLEKHGRVLAFYPASTEEPFVGFYLRSEMIVSWFCFVFCF